MANYPLLKKLFCLPLAAILLQSCSNGKNSASADINKFTLDIGKFTDSRDGKIYKTTKIGEQVWMAENLNYNISESICYDDKAKNCDKYGRLYNWETAMKVCPTGWHLPKNEEWDILIGYVGNTDKLKEMNSWSSPNTWYSYMGKNTDMLFAFFAINAWGCRFDGECFLVLSGFTLALASIYSYIYVSISPSANAKFNGIDNNYGFSALPGGYVESNAKKSMEIKKHGLWWTATEADSSNAYYRSLYHNMYNVVKRNDDKFYLLSVRCVLN
jgi:uncharacterized protein (TIGR02145 family)